ncbi:MAG: carbohydrate ABC transporter permease [Clostridia bacterium]|nr:carbohydrate ABC transporter permease [Clostridia bacterium]
MEKTVKIKKRKKVAIPLIIASVIFCIYGVSLAVPILWGFIMSLKEPFDYFYDQLSFPDPPHFENYVRAFQELSAEGTPLLLMLFNSIWYSVGGTIVPVFACMTAGYVCAKYQYKICRIWYWIALVTMIIPVMGTMASSLKLSMDLGFYDNPATLVTGYMATGSNFIIMYAFFKGVDWGYAESAFIDGAGHARVFFQIMLPQATSPIIAVALTVFISKWGDSQGPIMYLPHWPTLASGFFQFQQTAGKDQYPIMFAGLLMSAIPIIILYIAFQDKLMSLNLGGGLKG